MSVLLFPAESDWSSSSELPTCSASYGLVPHKYIVGSSMYAAKTALHAAEPYWWLCTPPFSPVFVLLSTFSWISRCSSFFFSTGETTRQRRNPSWPFYNNRVSPYEPNSGFLCWVWLTHTLVLMAITAMHYTPTYTVQASLWLYTLLLGAAYMHCMQEVTSPSIAVTGSAC